MLPARPLPLSLGIVGLLACSPFLPACGGRVESTSEPTGTPTVPYPTASPTNQVPPPSSPPSTPTMPPWPSGPNQGVYSALAWGGGLEHVEIAKADFGADTCTRVHLVSPVTSPSAGFASISVPKGWVVSAADRGPGAKGCSAQPGTATESGAAGKGAITWTLSPGQFRPCALDIHAVVLFRAASGPEQLDADGVPVTDCM